MTAKNKKMQTMTNESLHQCVCHKCSSLGALSFHPDVKGHLITLSEGGRRASRDESSYRYGLVFSKRPVQIREKVRVRVERSMGTWKGSLRVGFTNVPPVETVLPPLAIPDLTDSSLYAATIFPEGTCYPGSEIEFWIDRNGSLRTQRSDGTRSSQSTSLNVHMPIWVMIDVYGQTSAVVLLGSKKRGLLRTYRSCPAFTHNRHSNDKSGYGHINKDPLKSIQEQRNHYTNNTDTEAFGCEDCVVCCSRIPNILLSCGHKCVCTLCAMRVYKRFGTCPLCRQHIRPIQFH